MDKVDFLILTRFGVGVTDPAWFETRFKLFEAITFPSILAQTCRDFRWRIFVGNEPFDWVVQRLCQICSPLGDRVQLVRAAQTGTTVRRVVNEDKRGTYLVTALIDDDDAWHVDMVQAAQEIACELTAEGISRCGFTFESGYEWLVSDMIDLDALGKGDRVVRRSAVYPYRRPFLTMSCFTVTTHEQCFERVGGMHSSRGEVLASYGVSSRVLDHLNPAWLYVRHQQADSAIHKAHANAPIPVPLSELASTFGIREDLVKRFREEAGSLPYAAKRSHSLADKSNLTFQVSMTGGFRSDGLRPEGGIYRINPRGDHGVTQAQCRLVVFDNRREEFCVHEVGSSDDDFVLQLSRLPKHLDCKYKLQVRTESRWVDRVAYVRLLPPI